jgi:hypothetical protein
MTRQAGAEREIGTVRSRRRWSLGSSDTSSIQRPVSRKFKAGAGSQRQHHHHHRDIKYVTCSYKFGTSVSITSYEKKV